MLILSKLLWIITIVGFLFAFLFGLYTLISRSEAAQNLNPHPSYSLTNNE